ncbi:MAG: hypothetical protein ACLGGV_07500 [Bacteroidia bacterium]
MRLLVISFILCFNSVFAQKIVKEVSSFYFSAPQPASLPEVTEFDESIHGIYQLSTQKHTKLIVKKDSILANYYSVFQITQQDINENSQLYIDNNLIFGIAPEGLPFVKENDTLIIAMNQTEVFCTMKEYVIKRNKNTYYINEKVSENKWKTTILDFGSKEVLMQELNHDLVINEIEKLPKEIDYDNSGMRIYVATPSDKDFYSLAKGKGYTSEKIVYRRI